MINLDKIIIDIACPKCKFINRVTLGDVSVQRRIICRGCKVGIKLVDKKASATKAKKSIKKSMDNLKKAIKKTKLTIKI